MACGLHPQGHLGPLKGTEEGGEVMASAAGQSDNRHIRHTGSGRERRAWRLATVRRGQGLARDGDDALASSLSGKLIRNCEEW